MKSFVILTCLLLFSAILYAQVNTPDYRLLRLIAKSRTETMNHFFIVVSDLNNPLCLGIALLLLLSRWVIKDHKYFRAGLLVGQSIFFSQIITFTIKDVTGRLRPHLYDSTFLSVIEANNKSFPSGHTSEAFTLATAICFSFSQWWIRVLAMGWACTVAYARMYLGVHYPSDVIGGIIVGSGSVWLVVMLQRNWDKRKLKKIGEG